MADRLGSDRHPAVEQAARWLIPNPNLQGVHRRVSEEFSLLAARLLGMLGDGQQTTIMLNKLVEAKDAAVRQSILDKESER